METSSAGSNQFRVQAAEQSLGTSADAIYDAILREVRGAFGHRRGGEVLDYGAGKGLLAHRLAQAEIFDEVHACDLIAYDRQCDPRVRWTIQDLNEPIPGFEQRFDCVIAAEVIEHLENPRATVRDLTRLCRVGGMVLVSTPNNNSLRSLLALIMGGHFAEFRDRSYPAHITALLRLDLERIFQEAGLTNIRCSYTGRGWLPSSTLTWQGISGGLLDGQLFSDNIIVTGHKQA